MFGHAALQPFLSTGVFARTEPGVTGDLPTISKAMPVADLPVDDDRGHFAQTTRWLSGGGVLQLERELIDLLLQREHNRLTVA